MSAGENATSRLPGVTAEQALEAAAEAVLVLNPQGLVVFASPAAAGLLSPEAGTLIGQHFLQTGLFGPAAQEKAADLFLGTMNGTAMEPCQVEVPGPGSSRRQLEVTARALKQGLRIAAVLLVLRDLTEHLQLRERLRLTQKLETLGRLATGLAHDFNNILTVVKGYAEVMLLKADLAADHVRHLKSMATAAERGASVTRQLLTFSRRQVVQPTVLDLNEVLSNVTQMLRRLLGEQMALHFSYAPGLPPVRADLGMLEQMISNIVLHARDNLPQGGVLRLETSLRTADETPLPTHRAAKPGPYLCLTFTDDGPGMEPAAAAHLFTTAASTPGSEWAPRLGLHIANSVAQQHEGWMEAASAPDQGTRIQVFLPAFVAPAETGAAAPAAPLPRGQETILIAEDEPSIRELARSILSGCGYRVLEAGSGPEALAAAAQAETPLDLLFTDMVMPGGMNGRALAQELERRRPGLRVLYTTGYSLDLVQSNLVLKPGVNLLPKPYNSSALAQAVRQCLDRQ